jgi:response regulator RpfG family c-di-GMP phosphodiesterase
MDDTMAAFSRSGVSLPNEWMTAPELPITSWRQPDVLIVDDDSSMISFVDGALSGVRCRSASTGLAALEQLRLNDIGVMVCDIGLGSESGLDLIEPALAASPQLAIVMLTADDAAHTMRTALQRGACDYLVKPIGVAELHESVARAMATRHAMVKQLHNAEAVRQRVTEVTLELDAGRRALQDLGTNVVTALVNAMEARDPFLRGHSLRVGELAADIGATMKVSPATIEHLRLAGHLHDVGKIGIRESVLQKPGPLTYEEFEHVKQHVRIGVEILSPLPNLGPALGFIAEHHEHFGGGGYPGGLRGDEISLGGRIIAVADAFDALTSRRTYRDAMGQGQAIRFLEERAGTMLDPVVLSALLDTLKRRKAATAA